MSRRTLALAVAASVAVKLFLMSATFHPDLLFVQYFPSFFARQNILDIYGYFGDHFSSRTGGTYYPPLVYFMIGFFQKLWMPLVFGSAEFFDYVHRTSYSFQFKTSADFLAPYPWPRIAPLLVGMKFPYLAFDLTGLALVCFLAVRTGAAGDRLQKIVLSWSWNPVILFAAYVFGQYRTLSMAVMLGALLLLRFGRTRLFCLAYGAFCITENIGVFLIPAVVMTVASGWRDRFRILLWILALPTVVMVPLVIHSNGFALDVYFSSRLMKAVGARGITNHHLSLVLPITKAVLAGSYLWVLWKIFRGRLPENAEERFAVFLSTMTTLILVVYATSITSAHYWLWILPFLYAQAVVGRREAPWRAALWTAAVILLFVFNLDSRELNAGLFAPLDPALASVPSLHQIMDRYLPWGKCVAAARLGFSAVCLVLAWSGFDKLASLKRREL